MDNLDAETNENGKPKGGWDETQHGNVKLSIFDVVKAGLVILPHEIMPIEVGSIWLEALYNLVDMYVFSKCLGFRNHF